METFEEALERFDVSKIDPLSNAEGLLTIEKNGGEEDRKIMECKTALQFSPEDIIALTRLIKFGHPGFPDFSQEVQENFLAEMKQLYNEALERANKKDNTKMLDGDEALKIADNVWAAIEKLPDNHLHCSVIQKDYKEKCIYYHEGPTEKQVGQNLMPKKNDAGKINFGGIKYEKINGKQVAIVMMPNTGIMSDMSKVYSFLDDFDEMMKHADSLDNIILDVRSNPGGATSVHEYIARRLCGNEVPKCELETTRGTKEGAYILRQTREIPETEVEKHAQSEQIISDGRGYLAKYSAFEEGGFKKPIFILQNRTTCSAGEAFVYMMRNHPNAVTIGSNTAGCITYAGRKNVFLNNGFGIKIPFSKQTFADQNGKPITVEGKGFDPDIRISENAYDFVTDPSNADVITNALKDKNNAVSKRLKKEEKVKNQPDGAIPAISSMKEITQSDADDNVIAEFFVRIYGIRNLSILNSLRSFAKACKVPQIPRLEEPALTGKPSNSNIAISTINNKLER